MDLTLAYTMFPRGGSRPAKPFVITKIEDKTGAVLFEEKPEYVPVIKDTTAYEVHSSLAQVLDQDGTAERASTELGLKRYPLGGKTGTAYNFTDLWFCGYSSEVTCSVWIGFEQQRGKPKRTIFRGAFSKDLALPVWAEAMKASFDAYKPKDFVQPKGIIRVEICRMSGGLACDKCVENGLRTTYHEMATEEQAPKDPCPVHSGFVPLAANSGQPSADGAVRPKLIQQEGLTPIKITAPVVAGKDPYESDKAVAKLLAMGNVGNAITSIVTTNDIPTPDANSQQPPIAPAPVPVVVPPVPSSDVKLDQPEPLKFN